MRKKGSEKDHDTKKTKQSETMIKRYIKKCEMTFSLSLYKLVKSVKYKITPLHILWFTFFLTECVVKSLEMDIKGKQN